MPMEPGPPTPPAPEAPPAGRLARWLGEPGSTRRVVARNTLWTWAVFFANAITLFLLAAFLVRDLGEAAYGFWSFFLALTGYYGLADLGVRPAVVHFVARHDALGDREGLARHVHGAFAVFSLGALLFALLTVATAIVLPHLGKVVEGVDLDDARAVVWIVGLEIAFTLPFNAYTAVLIGRQRFDIVGAIDLGVLALRAGVTIWLVETGHGLVALAIAHAAAGLLEIGLKTWIALRTVPGLGISLGKPDRGAVRALLGYGGWAMFISIAMMLTWQTDPIVVGAALGAASVAHFTNPGSLASQARAVLWAACRVLAPVAGVLQARGDHQALSRLLVSSCRTMLMLYGPILAYLLALGDPFLDAWLGHGFRGESVAVLTVLALGVAAPIASQPLVQLLYGVGRMRVLGFVTLLEGVANLVLSLALVGPYGIVGVAIGTAIPGFLVHALVLPALVARPFGLSWARLTLAVWPRPLVCGALTWLILEQLTDHEATYGWPALFAYMGVAVAVQATLAFVTQRIVPAREASPA
jgi:O-antigen/teichoic acid export membrane protein